MYREIFCLSLEGGSQPRGLTAVGLLMRSGERKGKKKNGGYLIVVEIVVKKNEGGTGAASASLPRLRRERE